MPLPFAAIGLGISAITSGVNLMSGLKRKNEAQKKLARFRRQELRNVADGMQVARLGADLRAAESARAFSSSVDALRSGGVRALVGGLNRAEVQRKAEMGNIAASLEMQQAQIQRVRAQDAANIRNIQEKRDYAEIAGLGKEISEGRNQAQQGAFGLMSTAFAGAKLQKAGMLGTGAGGGGSLFGSGSGGGFLNVTNTGASVGSDLANTSSNFISSPGGGGVIDVGAALSSSVGNAQNIMAGFPSAAFSTQAAGGAAAGGFAVNANVPELGIKYGLIERD